MTTVGVLKWTLLMQPGMILRVFITSVSKTPDKLLNNAREYEKRFMKELEYISDVNRVDVYIDSHGGVVNSALGMLSALYKHFGSVPCRVLIDGECGSAATIVAFGVNGPVYITPRSQVYLHMPKMLSCMRRGGIWNITEAIGKNNTLQIMLAAYRSKTKQPRHLIRKWIRDSRRFNAKEACEAGFCDSVMTRGDFEKGNRI